MGSQPAAHRAVTLQHMHICISQAEIPLIRLLKLPFTKLSRRAASKPRPPAAGQADRQPAWALWPNGPMALWSASSPSSPPVWLCGRVQRCALTRSSRAERRVGPRPGQGCAALGTRPQLAAASGVSQTVTASVTYGRRPQRATALPGRRGCRVRAHAGPTHGPRRPRRCPYQVTK